MSASGNAAGPLPPLVGVGPGLSDRDRARFHRHTILPQLGEDGQRRLRNARVLVIGAGGLGAPTLMYLTAAGVGTIGIVDFDVVEESNLHRQVIHGEADVGRRKVDSALDSMRAIDSQVRVRLHAEPLDNGNAVEIFGQYDLILDGTDNFATRYLVNDAAVLAGRPYVWGSIFRFSGQVSVFWDGAPDGRGVNYRDLYPEPPAPGTVPSCAEGGVLGVLCAAVGSVMATEAVKLIAGIGRPLLGRLLIYDALEMSHRTIGIRKDPAAPPITGLVDYERLCGAPDAPLVPETSARELAAELDAAAGEGSGRVELIDVREPDEWAIARIPGARLVPLGGFAAGAEDPLAELPPERRVVVYCKSGARSAQATAWLLEHGHRDVCNLAGGIDDWARTVDTAMPRY
ncbi:ThiF family adenylyltransferase [Tomitella fengzijianii]|uniref:Adenylyltransferase/sulfurtransferase MoeZ n=1 Tax=Tomitella fengzijianii TaxID=2597660 RepID=A0A516X8H1_9ACTN|nr:ThiF family adenylyltransferase [Tomitella fengzijianii]QDQ99366.1 adenylyltransferase/sulfurtransferase MoeZ [Tomitella fengzijianii]